MYTITLTSKERFNNKYKKNIKNKCWNWLASKDIYGYGQFYNEGKVVKAHRFSYELYITPIINNLQVLHSCDNRGCVNPHHLFLGTNLDSIRDKIAKGRARWGNHKGESNPKAKLTNLDVISIRQKISKGEKSIHLSKYYNVSKQTISNIKLGKTWNY